MELGIASFVIIGVGVVLILTGLYLSVSDWRRKNPEEADGPVVTEALGTLGDLAKLAEALKGYPLGMQLIFVGIAVLIVGGAFGGAGALVSGS